MSFPHPLPYSKLPAEHVCILVLPAVPDCCPCFPSLPRIACLHELLFFSSGFLSDLQAFATDIVKSIELEPNSHELQIKVYTYIDRRVGIDLRSFPDQHLVNPGMTPIDSIADCYLVVALIRLTASRSDFGGNVNHKFQSCVSKGRRQYKSAKGSMESTPHGASPMLPQKQQSLPCIALQKAWAAGLVSVIPTTSTPAQPSTFMRLR